MARPSTAAAPPASLLELSVGQEEESEEWDLIPKGMVLSPVVSEGTPLGSPSKSSTPKFSQVGNKITGDRSELSRDINDPLTTQNLPAHSGQEQASTATQEEVSSSLQQSNSTATSHDTMKKSTKKVWCSVIYSCTA